MQAATKVFVDTFVSEGSGFHLSKEKDFEVAYQRAIQPELRAKTNYMKTLTVFLAGKGCTILRGR